MFDVTTELAKEANDKMVQIARLKSDNAKLRELVRELWSMAYWYVPDLSELDEAKDRMRELEVWR